MLKLILLLQFLSPIRSNLINLEMERDVLIQSQLVKTTTKIIFTNISPNSTNTYLYLIDSKVTDYCIKFTTTFGDNLYHIKRNIDEKAEYIQVFLSHPIDLDEVREIMVEEIHINQLKMALKKKFIDDYDLVKLNTNNNCFSIYETLQCVCNYTLLNFFQYDYENRQNNRINYSFNAPLIPFSEDYINVILLTKIPFMHANLDRVIDVSHYGKITVKDSVELMNQGAKIEGPYDSRRKHKEYLFTHLPSSAENVVLYDPLGARYNYHIINSDTHKTLKFTSRYPLFGGWKTAYTVEYSLPIYEYLYNNNKNKYQLEMRIFDHILNDAIIDKFTTKIILPENSIITNYMIPKPFNRLNDTLTITHLSCYGRPTIVIIGNNLIEDHITNFGIEYDFELMYLLRVSLKFCGYCYVLFVTYLFLSRFAKCFAL